MDPQKLSHEIYTAGESWAEAEAAAQLLEETRKTVLSQIKSKYDGSDAAKETLALATPEYREHLERMVNARRDANKARVRWDSLKIHADLVRTKAASARAEMRNLG